MAWEIRITKTAEKQIKSLDKVVQTRVVKFLQEITNSKTPQQSGKELKGNKAKLWRYRIGNYRLICDIHHEEKRIVILEVAHRKDIYR